jgi:hypothetical protein
MKTKHRQRNFKREVSSVVEHLPSLQKALDFIPCTKKKKKKKNPRANNHTKKKKAEGKLPQEIHIYMRINQFAQSHKTSF